MDDVYLTSFGTFFPGDPVSNEQVEERLGVIGKGSKSKRRVLSQNGIELRHYALDNRQRSTHSNAEMASLAVGDCLKRGGRSLEALRFLSAATTQGDVLAPGFASMVHGELGGGPLDIASLHGICASGLLALRSAASRVREGTAPAVACGSEFVSRALKASHFQDPSGAGRSSLDFSSEFLRWMLSDGAGAALLEPEPRGLSLRLDWVDVRSHAHRFPPIMVAGAPPQGVNSWLDCAHPAVAAAEGMFELRQDVRRLDDVVKLGVDGFFRLIEEGRCDADSYDWVVCHYSSHFFRSRIFELLHAGGVRIPEERWFSNLKTRGNVGAASTYVLLEELFHSGKIEPGQRILLMIPESGRALVGFAQFTAVEPNRRGQPANASGFSGTRSHAAQGNGSPANTTHGSPGTNPPSAPSLNVGGDAQLQAVVRGLTRVWVAFEQDLREVPILRRLEEGSFSLHDYQRLLVNMRQQVMEGSRWITRAASSLDISGAALRSLFIHHAKDEHRDYELLEQDFVSVGGALSEIQNAEKNVGSEALSAWMFHRAGQPNPFDLLGAMFVIEGLGNQLAARWAERIQELLRLSENQVRFLAYHGVNDENHFERLEDALSSGIVTPEVGASIVKTAKVTARLYRLQLEEIDRV